MQSEHRKTREACLPQGPWLPVHHVLSLPLCCSKPSVACFAASHNNSRLSLPCVLCIYSSSTTEDFSCSHLLLILQDSIQTSTYTEIQPPSYLACAFACSLASVCSSEQILMSWALSLTHTMQGCYLRSRLVLNRD